MLDNIQAIIALITSIISVWGAIYKVALQKGHNREEAYYEQILKPFIVELHKNSNINPIKFLQKMAKRNNDNIPKYIFYLMDKKENEKLKKVIITDYLEFYHNDDNVMSKVGRIINKVVVYGFNVMAIFTIFYTCVYVVRASSTIGTDFELEINGVIFNSITWWLVEMGMALLLFGTSILCVKVASWLDNDIFTYKKER